MISLVAIAGCERHNSVVPTISLTGNTECKGAGLKAGEDHSSSQDCVLYRWVPGDTLFIRHVNAGFNCCPEGFRTELNISGDTIVISEYENSALCDCNCLFDLEYELTGINRGNWWIRVEEPYVQQPGQMKIIFRANLKKMEQEEFCITRSEYPWGM